MEMPEPLSNSPPSTVDAVADAPPPQDSMSTRLTLAPATEENTPKPRERSKHEKHARPIPIGTFSLPPYYPNNPLSLVHIAYAWLRQTVFAPREPAVIHTGVWSPETRSVHVHDEQSMTALWEQGFFGKGHLSRSEPNWQRAQEVKRGLKKDFVSELHTAERRNERKRMKWERARLEQEVIRQTRLKEEYEHAIEVLQSLPPPVGPLELLALPNRHPIAPGSDTLSNGVLNGHASESSGLDNAAILTDMARMGTPNGSYENTTSLGDHGSGTLNGVIPPNGQAPPVNGVEGLETIPVDEESQRNGSGEFKPTPIKRRKSVRFSPKVESTTFQLSDPPSPGVATVNGKGLNGSASAEKANGTKLASLRLNGSLSDEVSPKEDEVNTEIESTPNKEHLQLSREEAFFLAFGLGVLTVVDGESKQPIPTAELFNLFCRYSVIPPPAGRADLRPDDKFLVQYAVYHHFRSLGWVPRTGLKFAVDWLLYHKGPVFDHAEYGVVVIPSYSDPWWKEQGQDAPKKTWAGFHNTMRGLSHVFKTIAPVYVDIPPPAAFDDALEKGVTEVLKLYKVREVVVTRFRFTKLRAKTPPKDQGKGKEKEKDKAEKTKKEGKKPEVHQNDEASASTEAVAGNEVDA